jgi:hypothetical protein
MVTQESHKSNGTQATMATHPDRDSSVPLDVLLERPAQPSPEHVAHHTRLVMTTRASTDNDPRKPQKKG